MSDEVICGFFFASLTIFLTVVAEFCVGLRGCGLGSPESLNFNLIKSV